MKGDSEVFLVGISRKQHSPESSVMADMHLQASLLLSPRQFLTWKGQVYQENDLSIFIFLCYSVLAIFLRDKKYLLLLTRNYFATPSRLGYLTLFLKQKKSFIYMPGGMWDLSSLIRDQTQAHSNGRVAL